MRIIVPVCVVCVCECVCDPGVGARGQRREEREWEQGKAYWWACDMRKGRERRGARTFVIGEI